MGQLLLHRTRSLAQGHAPRFRIPRSGSDPSSTARGILIAVAVSLLFWAGALLVVPVLW